ncbi:MAG: deoxyribonuclease IV [Candidatus Moeniiplasma glomeromycotorum]|nr:deoxyribonuclease IV [Candidatus Moeniiplasma glomeromycotorum]MCE8168366.1 deoxyribonuclease IV [Candidatus Moeniiplasma glomeromycotorum]MCE8169898.1 deoxyribonuclease IV [Candidatus Moeniiplasma glomeromycotorum]
MTPKPETTTKYNLLIGRHCLVKSPLFLLGAVQETLTYGANSLMFHLGAPQNSFRRALEELKIPEFKQVLTENKIADSQVIVHGPYLINLANSSNPKNFFWSVEFLKKELMRAEKIGAETFVLHPGNALKTPLPTALDQVVQGLNLVLQNDTKIRIALETMSGKGSEVGITFEQLQYIITRVKSKERVGVCWDTCHLWAAGYDIKNNLETVIKEFEEKIGLEKLWVIHVNDSLFELGSKKDRHENLGYGKIGWEALQKIVYHPKFEKIIKILETPRQREIYKTEIQNLLKFCRNLQ